MQLSVPGLLFLPLKVVNDFWPKNNRISFFAAIGFLVPAKFLLVTNPPMEVALGTNMFGM